MAEDMYYTQLSDGRSWKCVMAQLRKTGGKSPVNNKLVRPDYVEV